MTSPGLIRNMINVFVWKGRVGSVFLFLSTFLVNFTVVISVLSRYCGII